MSYLNHSEKNKMSKLKEKENYLYLQTTLKNQLISHIHKKTVSTNTVLVKFKDTKSTYKNQLYFYILITKYLERNQENYQTYNAIKNHKILRKYFQQLGESVH